jgi:peptidoglycan/xylan/chitin deacetylase (PgdA/CDA1 family)
MSAHEETRRLVSGDAGRWRTAAGVLLLAFVLAGVLSDSSHHGDAAFVAAHNPPARGLKALAPRVFSRGAPRVAPEDRAVTRVLGYAPFVSSGGRRGRLVALTFDDGPGPYTARIARVLRRLHVPATFFQVGQMMSAFPSQARAVRRRFVVGDHSLSHPFFASLNARQQATEVVEQAARMQVYGGRFPRLFRPPYASFNSATMRVLHRFRMLMVLWSVDSEDYTRPGTRRIVSNVVSRVRPGAIVLMHDAGGPREQTARALPLIVRRLRARGYRFVTVPRMMLEAPPARGGQRVPRGVPQRARARARRRGRAKERARPKDNARARARTRARDRHEQAKRRERSRKRKRDDPPRKHARSRNHRDR